MQRRTAFFWILTFPLQWALLAYAQAHPTLIDRWYGQEWYPFLAKAKNGLQWIPFSLGDLLYGGGILFVIYSLYALIRAKFKGLGLFLLQSLAVAALLHLFFVLSWGLNYYKPSLAQKKKIALQYSEEELVETLGYWIEQSNALHQQLAPTDSLPVEIPLDQKAIVAALQTTTEENTAVKNSLWSIPLSYMGYAGYLNPFTGEAQVNGHIPRLSYITTAAHEMAHQQGYAPEQEANYQAFLTTTHHPNPYIRYAGATFALRYCLNALYPLNPEAAMALKEKIRPGILVNFQALAAFWKAHQNPLGPFFELFYDRYLKSQGQKAGVISYSLVVAFIVHDTKNEISNSNQ